MRTTRSARHSTQYTPLPTVLSMLVLAPLAHSTDSVHPKASPPMPAARGYDRLQEHLDIDDLPEFLGGKDTSCDFVREVGPWAEYVPALK